MRAGGKKSEGIALSLNLFFMVGDVNSFPAKPVLDLIVTAYDHKAVITILIH